MTITRLFRCGFEFGNALEFDWSGVNTPASYLSTSYYYTGLRAFYSGAVSGSGNGAGPGKAFSSTTQIRAGYWYKRADTTYSTVDAWFWKWTNTAGETNGIAKVGTDLQLIVNNVAVATIAFSSTDLNDTGDYHHVGLAFKADSSAGWATLYVDGLAILTWSGDTGSDITGLYAGVHKSGSGHYFYHHILDDLYIHATTGEADASPPELTFEPLWVNGDSGSQQWTPTSGNNYTNVDEQGNKDDDTTIVSTTANAQVDRYTLTDLPTLAAGRVPRAVAVVAAGKHSEAGPQLKLKAKVDSNEETSAAKALGTNYTYIEATLTLQPDGVSSWTEAAVNGLIIGIESVIP
jgi:hypothetical protein